MNKPFGTGLVLSGGGARGYAHVGALKAFDEIGLKIDAISGVSAGAVIGAFYAAGFKPDEILSVTRHLELFRMVDVRLLRPGLFKTDAVRKSLNRHLSGMTFAGLSIPLTVMTTDFERAVSFPVSSGNVVEALLASSAIPALFHPVMIDGKVLVDGGVLNNFPVEPLLETSERIIGIHVNPVGSVEALKLKIPAVIERSFNLAVSQAVKQKSQSCSLFIEPPGLAGFGVFDFDKAETIARIGYLHTLTYRDEIERIAGSQ